jgi:hypothetical protein
MPRQPRKSQAQLALGNESNRINQTIVRLYREADMLKAQAEALSKVRDNIDQQIHLLAQASRK